MGHKIILETQVGGKLDERHSPAETDEGLLEDIIAFVREVGIFNHGDMIRIEED